MTLVCFRIFNFNKYQYVSHECRSRFQINFKTRSLLSISEMFDFAVVNKRNFVFLYIHQQRIQTFKKEEGSRMLLL